MAKQIQPPLRVVTESGELRHAWLTLNAIARELRHLVRQQGLRRDLLMSSSFHDRREVTRMDGRSVEPLRDSPLRNADQPAKLVLAPNDRDDTLESFHQHKISAAYDEIQQRRCWPSTGPSISVANMTSKDGKKAKPTPADSAAAKRLKKAWLDMPRARRPTQEQLAERYGEGGSQSVISQYMNGVIPLNIRATMFFAHELGVDPRQIYPDLPGLDLATAEPRDLAEDDLDREWRAFPRELKAQIIETVRRAQGTRFEQSKRSTPVSPTAPPTELRRHKRRT